MLKLILDGREVEAQQGATILEVARKSSVHIPTLCHHPALEPYGACRLCVVEVTTRGRKRLVTSCNYPAADGIEVNTNSEEVRMVRRTILELLLARCPNVELIQNLAKEYGVEKPRFIAEDEQCILCGLCTRICQERMGIGAIGFVGRGIDQRVDTPFGKPSDVCQTCGACEFVCPTGAIKIQDITTNKPRPILSEFDEGLRARGPIYIPYPQAVPKIPVIDRENCIHFLTGECGVCEAVCEAGAIKYDQEDEILEVEVGAVILAPGFDKFDAKVFSNYGYGIYPNVVTSMEFERILSASGPFQGHLVRPSDKKPPQKIAWIQCVGSRDVNVAKNNYCSSVCCTYAVKEAVVAKEHSATPVDTTIFFMDMRTYGKGFESYYERAKQEYGVRFIRSRISNILQEANGDLLIRYAEEDGVREDTFSMVVLSVGLRPPAAAAELAQRFGIKLESHGFCQAEDFSPVTTSSPGIFAAGAFTGPKDIPETVVQASAAAGEASRLLSSSRHSLTSEKRYPPEINITGQKPRIGVFVCHCGINIGGVVNVPAVRDYALTLPNVVHIDDTIFTCSQDSQQKIKEAIKEHRLNRIVVASCTPRTHEPLFQDTLREAGLNKHLFEMANIRDQCSWVHMREPEKATEKAKDLVRMAVAKARLIQPLGQIALGVNHSALVIGGGISGMTCALQLADQGFQVHLVENTSQLGGIANRIHHTLEGQDVRSYTKGLMARVEQDPLINVYLRAEILGVEGYVGNFKTKLLERVEGQITEIEHGVAIIACGGQVYKPNEYLYGQNPSVFTVLDMEQRIAEADPSILSSRNVVLIQCVGSREENRPYCSRICCSESVKCALSLKEVNPQANIYILYRDMRTYGFKEEYYQKARQQGVFFIRYDLDNKPIVETSVQDGKEVIKVCVTDAVLGDTLSIDADLLGLAAATIPSTSAEELARLFKVPLNEDGFFLEAHAKLRPVEFATEGVFVCGLAHGPKLIEESIGQAKAAVSRAVTVLAKDRIEAGGTVSVVDKRKCVGCGTCEQLCPFSAIAVDPEQKKAVVNEALCKGCGVCASSCRSGALNIKGFADNEIMSVISAGLVAVS
ncbi:FAD-dependent oxidoreductase [Chloroflexota bacterium]